MRGLAAIVLALSLATSTTAAEPIAVRSTPITSFMGAAIGQEVDGVVFRGGLEMTSTSADFGGISGITAISDASDMVMVTDVGQFISGRLTYDAQGAPSGFVDVETTPLRNSSGNQLPNRFSADAEAVETIFRDGEAVAVRVGYENLTRVADFDLVDGRPGGAARVIDIPQWLSALRTNESIESVCIAPPASPVAGSTLIITEAHTIARGTYAATLLGNRDRGDLGLAIAPGVNPTGCAFLPDGDLLVLERGLGFLAFTMQIRRIPAHVVMAGATMDGPVIVAAAGRAVDNMEGIAIHSGPNGETLITIVSDDNFNSFQRNLLLQFALP